MILASKRKLRFSPIFAALPDCSVRIGAMPLRIDIVTLFPGMLSGFLGQSMIKRASELGAVDFRLVDLREFTTDRHRTADDRPFGGGPGMILKPEPSASRGVSGQWTVDSGQSRSVDSGQWTVDSGQSRSVDSGQ